jgi:hypothetical protein
MHEFRRPNQIGTSDTDSYFGIHGTKWSVEGGCCRRPALPGQASLVRGLSAPYEASCTQMVLGIQSHVSGGEELAST